MCETGLQPKSGRAFTLIELVTATALLGFLLAGIAVLARTTVERLKSIDELGNDMLRDEIVSYLERKVDDMTVLTGWDSTRVFYVDRMGRIRCLDLTLFLKPFQPARNSGSGAMKLWISVRPVSEQYLASGLHGGPTDGGGYFSIIGIHLLLAESEADTIVICRSLRVRRY